MTTPNNSNVPTEVLVSNLTNGQNLAMAILTLPTGVLSIIGSCLILRDFCQRSASKRQTYDRILGALSTFDIFITLTCIGQRFLTPPDDNHRITSWGNHATCQLLGFFTQFGLASYFYAGMLALYYLFTIVHGWSHGKFARVLEPYLHAVAIGFPLITGSMGLIFVWYAPLDLGSMCYVTDYPRGCEASNGETPCWSGRIGWFILGIPVLAILALVIYCNVRVYRHVRHVIQKSRRHSFMAPPGSISRELQDEQEQQQNENPQTKRLRFVREQSIFYVLAFWGTAWPTAIHLNLEVFNYPVQHEQSLFALYIAQSLLTPSFGLWTALIYFRPRYLHIHKEFATSQSWTWKIRRTVWGDAVAPVTSDDSANKNAMKGKPGDSGETTSVKKNKSIPQHEAPGNLVIVEEARPVSSQDGHKNVTACV